MLWTVNPKVCWCLRWGIESRGFRPSTVGGVSPFWGIRHSRGTSPLSIQQVQSQQAIAVAAFRILCMAWGPFKAVFGQVYPIPLEITEENDGSRPPACRS